MRPPYKIFTGDVKDVLSGMASGSVNCCVTSPPYWGLRSYGIPPSVWGGDPNCEHCFVAGTVRADSSRPNWTGKVNGRGEQQEAFLSHRPDRPPDESSLCSRCRAWRGCLGLEETPEQFIANIVSVFREVRRVLHQSGTLWLNMGDSYVTNPHGSGKTVDPKYRGRSRNEDCGGRGGQTGMKPKDLLMIPARVAIALQQDGWFLRAQIPWIRTNPMPSSVVDRPTVSLEYVYLFSKEESYYYDKEAIRLSSSGTAHARGSGVNPKAKMPGPNSGMRRDKDPDHQTESNIRAKQNRSFSAAVVGLSSTRMRRDSDWYFESLRGIVEPFNFADGPLGIIVNPQAFSLQLCANCDTVYELCEYRKLPRESEEHPRECVCGSTNWVSHFASYPAALVAPMILAGTSEHGVCRVCGAPFERILRKAATGDWSPKKGSHHAKDTVARIKKIRDRELEPDSRHRVLKSVYEAREVSGCHDVPFLPPETIGWRPTCEHPLSAAIIGFEGDPSVPGRAVVLDPFCGTGRTGVAALKLGREFIGIDLNLHFVKLTEYQLKKCMEET